MPSVVVVGAGGVGLIYARLLQDRGHRVAVVARSNYEAIKSQGARFEYPSSEEDETEVIKFKEVYKFGESYTGDPFDYIVIAAKATGKAIDKIDQYAHSGSLILLAQNGIDIELPYIEQYPDLPVASAVVRVQVELSGENTVLHFSRGIWFEAGLVHAASNRDRAQASLEELIELSEEAEANFELSDNIVKSRWVKILWNAPFNCLAAITGLDLQQLFEVGFEPLLESVIHEVWSIGVVVVGAEDYEPKEVSQRLIDFTKTRTVNGFVPSTLQDVRKGKPIEHEALCGNLIEAANRVGVAVPQLELVNGLLKATNAKILAAKKSNL